MQHRPQLGLLCGPGLLPRDVQSITLNATASNRLDNFAHVRVAHVRGQHHTSVADDSHLVTKIEDFGQSMRDVDDSNSGIRNLPHDCEESPDFPRTQSRGRLVQDQKDARQPKGFRNLHHLLVGDAKLADEGVGGNNNAKLIFNSDGPSVGRKSLILLDRAGGVVKM